jgi:hypothetical protein
VSCNTCTRTCTNPHTGAAFAKVFTNYVSGVEAGNLTDGFLTASGDNDTSDPPDGMDGTGPWMQQVGGGFSDGGSYGGGTRFPCAYRFSFWRSVRGLGINSSSTSTALTENVIELTVTAGAVVYPDGTVITPASGTVALATVPLVSGGAGAVDPHSNEGTVSFALQCQNVETTFSIQARIRWNVQKRQHTLYGIVRECYEEGTPCATVCSGSPPPSSVYFNVSNATTSAVEGSYVIGRVPNFCASYYGYVDTECTKLETLGGIQDIFSINQNVPTVVSADEQTISGYFVWRDGSGVCNVRRFSISRPSSATWSYCGTGSLFSGTGANLFTLGGTTSVGTFDWSVTA